MVYQDAALAARATTGRGQRLALGNATLGASSHDPGPEEDVLESVPLCASASPPHELPGLSAAWLADRQRRDRGSLQNGVHATLQALGHALAARVRPSHSPFSRNA